MSWIKDDKIKLLERRLEAINQVNDGLHLIISKLKQDNNKLVEALEFYADACYDGMDGGYARQVLKEVGEE